MPLNEKITNILICAVAALFQALEVHALLFLSWHIVRIFEFKQHGVKKKEAKEFEFIGFPLTHGMVYPQDMPWILLTHDSLNFSSAGTDKSLTNYKSHSRETNGLGI